MKPHRLMEIKTGDIVLKLSSEGGGGSPAERDPERVREDVVNELVALRVAREVYRVVLDPATLVVDPEGTRALRAARG